MTDSASDFDISASLDACPRSAWRGEVWRIHRARYAATDPGGALKVSGRYHYGADAYAADAYAADDVFAALYLALAPEIALAELVRHVTPQMLPLLNDYRLTRLRVSLDDVLDLRASEFTSDARSRLLADGDPALTRALGRAVFDRGADGFLVPSATALGDNLIVLTENLRQTATLDVVSYRRPRLYVEPGER